MARIRTIKPEAFESESLASVSVTAVVTFFGLLTQSDDSGRHRDHPAIIAGRLWALRPSHTPAHVARDLEELADAELICRYTGCDGRTWLHIVTWDHHQKINRPTDSRLPRCPSHQATKMCGKCDTAQCPSTSLLVGAGALAADLREHAVNPHGGLLHPVSTDSGSGSNPTASYTAVNRAPSAADFREVDADLNDAKETAGQRNVGGEQVAAHAHGREESLPGSRILDPGSVPTGREAPAAGSVSEKVSTKDLVAEYAKGCKRRPPSDTLGLLGRKIKTLLDEDFAPRDIRSAMDLLRDKGLHPSVLPSLVNQVVNASPQRAGSPPASASGAGPWASTGSTYTPYQNPAAAPTTFGGSL
ncbi:hypothetical protein M8Z33_27770 [Streptomyces sp. ZAF1911]|uniref:hypothetical protein n=1 Tax=Streptomyces sp. ZAF1911 TaxID=2944129 RepID=UPI00237B5CCC|nr:hypothetical protein [Streptomyces sp. ZAF1911]MDD9380385.1 hypothetical protein [Streptomyces sp. ZAF1911]